MNPSNTQVSNFASSHNFVIQGYENVGGGWQDSIHGGRTREAAEELAKERADEIAMPGTRLRVVPARRTVIT